MPKSKNTFIKARSGTVPQKRSVASLLDVMKDGREYASLIDVVAHDLNLRDEIRRAIEDIQSIRNRPFIAYMANVIKPMPGAQTEIVYSDDLPFSEMVAAVPSNAQTLDISIVTPGGLAQQVSQFVNRVRPRFKDVSMILPYTAMSAGTIWALSGNEIWMDERALMGPIDPQVQGKDGRLVPAQALLTLLKRIQDDGQANLTKGQNPDWSDIQILKNIDPKELGNAISLSSYSIQLATNYLSTYKFRDWVHSNGTQASVTERSKAGEEAAKKLCSHENWKTHSHGISRDVAWSELKIKIDHPESVPGLDRAIRRFWALLYYVFENSSIAKIFISSDYALFKSVPSPK